MTFKRYVFDTNVLMSAILLPQSRAQLALDRALETGYFLVSLQTLEEFRTVLSRSKFERYQSLADRLSFYEVFVQSVRIIEIVQTITECRDPRDNKFLEVAVNGEADLLITGDQDLLILHPFRGIEILTINDFLSRFEV